MHRFRILLARLFGVETVQTRAPTAAEIHQFMLDHGHTRTVEVPVTVARLAPEVFAQLRDRLVNPLVTSTTTDGEAFYKLGVQYALRELEKGFVVSAA